MKRGPACVTDTPPCVRVMPCHPPKQEAYALARVQGKPLTPNPALPFHCARAHDACAHMRTMQVLPGVHRDGQVRRRAASDQHETQTRTNHKHSLRTAQHEMATFPKRMPQKTADVGNTESALSGRSRLGSVISSVRTAAQWGAAASLFPLSVVRGHARAHPRVVVGMGCRKRLSLVRAPTQASRL